MLYAVDRSPKWPLWQSTRDRRRHGCEDIPGVRVPGAKWLDLIPSSPLWRPLWRPLTTAQRPQETNGDSSALIKEIKRQTLSRAGQLWSALPGDRDPATEPPGLNSLPTATPARPETQGRWFLQGLRLMIFGVQGIAATFIVCAGLPLVNKFKSLR